MDEGLDEEVFWERNMGRGRQGYNAGCVGRGLYTCASGGLGAVAYIEYELALLTRWTSRIISPVEDVDIKVLKDCYGPCLDLERCVVPVHGASSLWQGLQHIFPQVCLHFFAKLGDVSLFCYWLDD